MYSVSSITQSLIPGKPSTFTAVRSQVVPSTRTPHTSSLFFFAFSLLIAPQASKQSEPRGGVNKHHKKVFVFLSLLKQVTLNVRYKRVPQIYLRSALSSYLPSFIDSHILRYIIDLFLFYLSSFLKLRDPNSNSLHGWKVRHSSVPPERTLTQQGYPPSPSASSPLSARTVFP